MTFIWPEETALKELMQGVIVSDFNNQTRPMRVWFGVPDIEVRTQDYPYATIDLVDVRPANDRQSSGLLTDDTLNQTVAPDPNFKYRYEVPIAYDLIYQITTYARHPRHDREIIDQMLRSRFPAKFGALVVPTANSLQSTARHMFLDEFTKRDFVEEGRRLHRNVFTITIVSEMDRDLASSAIDVVKERFINTNPDYIPSSFYPA